MIRRMNPGLGAEFTDEPRDELTLLGGEVVVSEIVDAVVLGVLPHGPDVLVDVGTAGRAEVVGGFDRVPAVPARLHRQLLSAVFVVDVLDKPSLLLDALVPLGAGGVVVDLLDHPEVGEHRHVFQVAIVEAGVGDAGEGDVSEDVGLDRLVDLGSVSGIPEPIAEPVGTGGHVPTVAGVVAPDDREQRGVVRRVGRLGVLDVQPGAQLPARVEDGILGDLDALQVDRLLVGDELGRVAVDVLDIATSERRRQGDAGAGVAEEIDQRPVAVVSSVVLQLRDLALGEDLIAVVALPEFDVGEFDPVVEAEVAILGLLVEELEEQFQGALVVEDPRPVGLQAVAPLVLRRGEFGQERTDVCHGHLDQWPPSTEGRPSEVPEVVHEGIRGLVLDVATVLDEVVDRLAVAIVDVRLFETIPLVVQPTLGVVRIPNVGHVQLHTAHIFGCLARTCARCSDKLHEHLFGPTAARPYLWPSLAGSGNRDDESYNTIERSPGSAGCQGVVA